MSQKRQNGFFERSHDRKSGITTLTRDYPAGHIIPLHFHDRDQLGYASRGVMSVRTGDASWVVPPHRAVWIPAQVSHTITMSGLVEMRTLYLKASLAKGLPRDCCVVNVSNLLKELILYVCTLGSLYRTVKWQKHVIAVIVHQLKAVRAVPLQLPHLSDPRLVRIAEIFMKRPPREQDPRPNRSGEWCQQEVDRKIISTQNRNDVWEVATAASTAAWHAALSGRYKGNARRFGIRL
jgi:mannose-6-phosphate isomerase-like protein (cupin superfamily)